MEELRVIPINSASQVTVWKDSVYTLSIELATNSNIQWGYVPNSYTRGRHFINSGSGNVYDDSKDLGMETYLRSVNSEYKPNGAKVGVSLTEGIDLEGPVKPLMGARAGRTVLTISGQNFQRSHLLRCHSILIASAASCDEAYERAAVLQSTSLSQSFKPDRTGAIQKIDLRLQIPEGDPFYYYSRHFTDACISYVLVC